MSRPGSNLIADVASREAIVSGHDLSETVALNRRLQAEAALGKQLGELDAMLLPLTLAVSRLAARNAVAFKHVSGGA